MPLVGQLAESAHCFCLQLLVTICSKNTTCRKSCNMLQFGPMKIAKSRKHLKTGSRGAGIRNARKRVREGDFEKQKAIASEVKLYLEDQKISRLKFEQLVKRGQSTISHFFAGDYSAALLARVEHVLGRKFGKSSAIAPPEWGGYTQDGTANIVGSYLTLRSDFKNPSQICAYVTSIEWGAIEQAHIFDGKLIRKPKVDGYGLIFREERRQDSKYTHRGGVWLPGQLLYLVSAYGDGRLRAAIVSAPDNDKMTGIQLSLHNPIGAAYVPAAAPIAFLRRPKIAGDELGFFAPGDPHYDEYRGVLDSAIGDVAFVLPAAIKG